MPLSLLNYSALVLFAQRTSIPTSASALASVPFGFVLVQVRMGVNELIWPFNSKVDLLLELTVIVVALLSIHTSFHTNTNPNDSQ